MGDKAPEPVPKKSAFERFVQRIAAVPKSKVDELQRAEQAKPSVESEPRPKGAITG